jgi:adenine-specific DNA-methyltransferase
MVELPPLVRDYCESARKMVAYAQLRATVLHKENAMVMERVENTTICELPLEALRKLAPDIAWKAAPTISPNLYPTEVCQIVGNWYVESSSEARRYQAGQFFTPAVVARYMANLAGRLHEQAYILDAGAGVGMLACALIELAKLQEASPITIVAYEADPVLYSLCSFTLRHARNFLQKHNLDVTIELHQQDFLEAMVAQFTSPSLWSNNPRPERPFDFAILNPPYFKVNQADKRAKIVKDIAFGRTNMYTMFMSLAASSLRIGGRFLSITPRSFASGAYFKQFRQQFFGMISPEHIHLFDSRRSTFEDADVLQENIIFAGVKKGVAIEDKPAVTISRSKGIDDLAYPLVQSIARQLILDEKQKDPVLHLPTSDIDTHLLQIFRGWKNRLSTYGVEISTGPVVPFRATECLTSSEKVQAGEAVPLLWLQHVRRMNIQWPLKNFDKPQAIATFGDQKLLVKNATHIILRRFSAKEEERRITAAVLPAQSFNTPLIGLENHLNYLYRSGGTLSSEEAVGIAAFLNSSLVDRYFRITNGNTQVNATELRSLPLPPLEQLISIGQQVMRLHAEQDIDLTERIVMETLEKDLIMGNINDLQLPILKDSRIAMGKIQEAQRILQELGLPPAQQNEISALTLLALCNLKETTSWNQLSGNTITIHNMMGFMKQHYGRIYAENTREVVRRQVIHQFEQARLVDHNPDNPARETNSPNYCYALTPEALYLFKQFGTASWEAELTHFLQQHGALWEQYQRKHKALALPLKLADGEQKYLTPGKHNELQIAIYETFRPHFAPEADLLYLGDAANKFVVFKSEQLKELGVPITTHDKLPDILLYLKEKNWLYLIEAVTSHGPVSHKRRHELESLLKDSKAKRIYVSAFHDFAEFGRHKSQIAWETEVWIADAPEHMIHYNGERFFGGYE